MNIKFSLLLLVAILLQTGCELETMTVHLSLVNETQTQLNDVAMEYSGRQKLVGILGSRALAGYSFYKIPEGLENVELTWTIDEVESQKVEIPPLPKLRAPPEVIFTYSQDGWRIDIAQPVTSKGLSRRNKDPDSIPVA